MANQLFKTMNSLNQRIEKTRESIVINHTKRKWVRIVSENVNIHLSPEKVEECKAFYKPYFPLNICFHEFYTEKTGTYDPRYIPDDLYYGVIDRYFNNHKMAAVLDNKCFYPRIFGDICRQAKLFAYRMNGYWYDRTLKPVTENVVMGGGEQLDELVIKKATDSFGGHGVSFISRNSDFTMTEQFKQVVSGITGDIVVQFPIVQHSEMAKLHRESINAIRAFSFLSREGEVNVDSVIVRMGSGTARVDNASSGGITCGVERDGTLKTRAFSPKGICYTEHPTTGMHFEQVQKPNFLKVLETVKKLHQQIPHFRIASWDIAIDKDGDPVLVEVNLRAGELDFHQLNNGPLFGDDTKAILDEVFH